MKDEALDSPLWVMMRTDALGQARLAAKLKAEPTQKFLNQKRSHATEIIPLILINMGVCIIYNQYKNVE